MLPSEFWACTPYEARLWADKRGRGSVLDAWRIGMFHHWDPKKYPKTAESLFPKKKVMSADSMFETMEAFAARHNAADRLRSKKSK